MLRKDSVVHMFLPIGEGSFVFLQTSTRLPFQMCFV